MPCLNSHRLKFYYIHCCHYLKILLGKNDINMKYKTVNYTYYEYITQIFFLDINFDSILYR